MPFRSAVCVLVNWEKPGVGCLELPRVLVEWLAGSRAAEGGGQLFAVACLSTGAQPCPFKVILRSQGWARCPHLRCLAAGPAPWVLPQAAVCWTFKEGPELLLGGSQAWREHRLLRSTPRRLEGRPGLGSESLWAVTQTHCFLLMGKERPGSWYQPLLQKVAETLRQVNSNSSARSSCVKLSCPLPPTAPFFILSLLKPRIFKN